MFVLPHSGLSFSFIMMNSGSSFSFSVPHVRPLVFGRSDFQPVIWAFFIFSLKPYMAYRSKAGHVSERAAASGVE